MRLNARTRRFANWALCGGGRISCRSMSSRLCSQKVPTDFVRTPGCSVAAARLMPIELDSPRSLFLRLPVARLPDHVTGGRAYRCYQQSTCIIRTCMRIHACLRHALCSQHLVFICAQRSLCAPVLPLRGSVPCRRTPPCHSSSRSIHVESRIHSSPLPRQSPARACHRSGSRPSFATTECSTSTRSITRPRSQ